ncbi:MAG: hypothetical protein ACSHW1_10265 [Yoonia sp.]|uniref:hypothetical protein n=1 Tax=Yoonia sp. TaxID=2212373 RepID=UPI003EF6594E
MTHDAKNETDAPRILHERDLMYFAASDSGWVADRAQLPDEAKSDLGGLLAKYAPDHGMEQVLGDLQRAFADAVEAAVLERAMAVAAEASKEAKKPSAKLGVYLRSRIDALMTVLDEDDISPEHICALVLEEPVLERLVTLQVEERLTWQVTDPLQNAPELAARHLVDVLPELRWQIDEGIKRGRIEASHDILADAVATVIARTTGATPKRNWNAHTQSEAGFGLDCCRVLARALNMALPPDLRREQPVDMAKAWRRMVEGMNLTD